MELDITEFFNTATPSLYSANAMEMGDAVGQITWHNAWLSSMDYPMLRTDEQVEGFCRHVKSFGAWSDEEIAAWSRQELNALLIQMISGDIREAGLDTKNPDWGSYEQGVQDGLYSGRLSHGHDTGEVFYNIDD